MRKRAEEKKQTKGVRPEYLLQVGGLYHVKSSNMVLNGAVYRGYSLIGRLVVHSFFLNGTEHRVTEPSIKKEGHVYSMDQLPKGFGCSDTNVVRQHEYPWEINK